MAGRISDHELRRLRNDVPIDRIIVKLGIPWKRRDDLLRFLCPHCDEFHTATNPDTNLARCFRCNVNFNPIDIVMAHYKLSFLDAVQELRHLHPPSDSSRGPPSISVRTHNANLVVLSDAEAILAFEGAGATGRCEERGFLSHRESDITSFVLDILDGGEHALEMRHKKYGRAQQKEGAGTADWPEP